MSPAVARACIIAAAVLWSSSGLFAKWPGFSSWPADSRGALLAFWRALFAAVVLLPFVRRPQLRLALVPMAGLFAAMNVTYLTAMTLSTAANAIWLQSTAPFWVFLVAFALGQRPSRLEMISLVLAAAGVGWILVFEVRSQSQAGVACGLAAGMAYAGVVLMLRHLRGENPVWLIVANHAVTALVLLPFPIVTGVWPTAAQLPVLVLFGTLQMGLPYLLFTRGLQAASAQEATALGLLEPLLLPLWVYAMWHEQPATWTFTGGALIMAALALRYGAPLILGRREATTERYSA